MSPDLVCSCTICRTEQLSVLDGTIPSCSAHIRLNFSDNPIVYYREHRAMNVSGNWAIVALSALLTSITKSKLGYGKKKFGSIHQKRPVKYEWIRIAVFGKKKIRCTQPEIFRCAQRSVAPLFIFACIVETVVILADQCGCAWFGNQKLIRVTFGSWIHVGWSNRVINNSAIALAAIA